MTLLELVEIIEMRTPGLLDEYQEHCYALRDSQEHINLMLKSDKCYYEWVVENFGTDEEVNQLNEEIT